MVHIVNYNYNNVSYNISKVFFVTCCTVYPKYKGKSMDDNRIKLLLITTTRQAIEALL